MVKRWWFITVLICLTGFGNDIAWLRNFLHPPSNSSLFVDGVWTKFDLVRTFDGAWGSNRTTPFVFISGANVTQNGPNITSSSSFGQSVANIGDLNGDGYDDIAVGAIGETVNYGKGELVNAGSIYILFMGYNGTVKDSLRINGNENGGPKVYSNDQFGFSMAAIGDLDGDGITELAVGAPGYIVSSVYILYLQNNGSVRHHRLIRGNFAGNAPALNITRNETREDTGTLFTANGPPIRYGCRFGTAVARMGDFNGDGVPDMAVSSVDNFGARNSIYILYLDRNATVIDYSHFGPEKGGGPKLTLYYSGYGSSLVSIPDMNNNSLPELVIGANLIYEAGSINPAAGEVFVTFLNDTGYVNNTMQISETSSALMGADKIIPQMPNDNCGAALTYIGDINRDAYRQKHPGGFARDREPHSIPDIVVGCPQIQSSGLPGRIMFVYLNRQGGLAGFTIIPAESDNFEETGLQLNPYDQFGRSLDAYMDIDKNGMKEIIVGAPGDDSAGKNAGGIYIIFPRRRRFHPIPFDFLTFILLVTLIPCICCSLICGAIAFFFWFFRRIPDEVEIVVKQSGLQIDPKKNRPKFQKKQNQVYCDQYTA